MTVSASEPNGIESSTTRRSNGYNNGITNGGSPPLQNGLTNGAITSQASSKTPIAICGLGVRLPGGIRHPDDFWSLLVEGRDARSTIPKDRFNIDGFNDTLGYSGAIRTRHGYFLDDDLSSLDTSFFNMSRNELERADPQQRQLLEVTKECFDSAGEVDYRGRDIGCYVGTFGEDWLQMSARENQHRGSYVLTGHCDIMLANRVSYEYDLRGPSLVIKTGCSASLTGVHDACRAIQAGDCSGAVVAGTSMIMAPTMTAAMTQEGILSPEGSCRTFDADADGFARAEAINAVYLKPLDAAIRDGNPVRAVIRNTAINADGRSQGLMSPRGECHEAMMRKVYAQVQLNPSETAFVECHGTGTATGDPIEANAVGNVFGEHGVLIGSVKPNVGHSEGASGLTSLIKAVLSLEHETIVPNIKFTNPNPKILFERYQMTVPTKASKWPKDRSRRISINSFGIGGANAHVIVDAADAFLPARTNESSSAPQSSSHLVLLSANAQSSLNHMIESHKAYLTNPSIHAADVARTLAMHREHLQYRSFMLARGKTVSEAAPPIKKAKKIVDTIFVFTGQGAQWPEMGKELIQQDAGFREDIRKMDTVLSALAHPPPWTIENELLKPKEDSRIDRAELSQPLCTAVQLALVNALGRYKIHPSAVVGHSSGEIGAAYASNALPMDVAIMIAYYRGFVTRNQPRRGAMAALGLGPAETAHFLRDGVVIACENSVNSTTISGDVDEVKRMIADVKEHRPDTLARELKVEMAYHSHHMDSLSAQYFMLMEDDMTKLSPVNTGPVVPFHSSVNSRTLHSDYVFDSSYWVANLTSPVLFSTAYDTILKAHPDAIALEIGPHSALAGPVRQMHQHANAPIRYVSALVRGQDCQDSLLNALGQVYQHGGDLDLASIFSEGRCLPDLPSYAFDHREAFWYESRLSKEWRLRNASHHALLGLQTFEAGGLGGSWRNVLHLEDEPWLRDHKIGNDVVFPFSGYMCLAGEAVRQYTHSGVSVGYSIKNIEVHTALVLNDSKPAEIVTQLYPQGQVHDSDGPWYDFSVSSYTGSTWIKHSEGSVRPRKEAFTNVVTVNDYVRKVPTSRWYESMAATGFVYGPDFWGLEDITASPTSQKATATVVNEAKRQDAPYAFHPGAIDNCLQLMLVALASGAGKSIGNLRMPVKIENVEINRSSALMKATASMSKDENMIVQCADESNKHLLSLSGVHFAPVSAENDAGAADVHAAARLTWAPDFNFIRHDTLFEAPPANTEETILLEELTLLYIIESAERLQNLEVCSWHFNNYGNWLHKELARASKGELVLVKHAKEYLGASPVDRSRLIENKRAELAGMNKAPIATALTRIHDNCQDIVTGRRDTLDILMEDDVLSRIYDSVSFGHGGFMKSMSHTKPKLRILEVGAGTGGTTAMFLRDLVDDEGNPSYAQYTFSDISAGFFTQAKERFSYAKNMDFKVLDIAKDPFEQGFDMHTYDLILAPNVIHATASLNETLSNLRPLLKPGGNLVLTELCGKARAPNYIFGNFSGWWLGVPDGRVDEPYISVERWDDELKRADFTGVETSVLDAMEPYHYCAAIVSRSKPNKDPAENQPALGIICSRPDAGPAQRVTTSLEEAGVNVRKFSLSNPPAKNMDVILVLDLEGSVFQDISAQDLAALQNFIRNNKSHATLWVTQPAQMGCRKTTTAESLGMVRTIRAELSLPFFSLEVDPTEERLGSLVASVWTKICEHSDDEELLPDYEYVVSEGVVNVGRYHPFSVIKRDASESATASSSTVSFDGEAAYILVGGLGGLGKSIATWMTEHGARNLIFLSRSAGSTEADKSYFYELESMGCSVSPIVGKVQDGIDVHKAIASANGRPIKGVIQLAMVLKDAPLLDMSHEDWTAAVKPKVAGTWNLHNALLSQPLDFFFMSSSILNVVTQPGQVNYSAANSFLEAFCQYRHSLGLPASVLNICPIAGVGYVADNAFAKKNLKSQGFYFLREKEFLDYVELLVSSPQFDSTSRTANWQNKGQVVMGLRSDLPLQDPQNRSGWRKDRRMGIYHNMTSVSDSANGDVGEGEELKNFLAEAANEPSILLGTDSVRFLAKEIGRKVLALILRDEADLDISLSPAQMGLDSLMAIELRRWWKMALGLEVSVLEIMGAGTVEELGKMAAENLAMK